MPAGPAPLIWNPASGSGRGRSFLAEARRLLEGAGLDVEPVATEGPHHAIDLAEALARAGHRRILVLGGDGTMSEAAQGVLRSGKRPALGLMPAGTGNDFLRDFGILDLAHAVDRIRLGVARPVDAGRIRFDGNERHFINILGTGFMAHAGATANRRFKWMGPRGYTAAVLWELARMRNVPTRLTLDGTEETVSTCMVAVCNSVHTGGAMKMAPLARPDDGWFDVLLCESMGRFELAGVFPRIFDGSHVRHPKVRMTRAKHVRIEPERPSPLLLDGEVLGSTPIDIQILPGALRVLL